MNTFIAASYSGIEDVVGKDIKDILNVKARKADNGRVVFSCENLGNFLDKAKSVSYVYRLLGKFKFRSLEDLQNKAAKLDYSFIKGNFVVRCKRHGDHDFNSIDAEQAIGEAIHNKGYNVDMKSKNIILADIVGNNCFIGLLLKDNMQKRYYRVRINKQGLNACMAYSLLKIAGWENQDSLLDPNCRDGIILIEAGLDGGEKLYGLENNKSNYKSAEINAKLAKIKLILYDYNVSQIDEVFKSVDFIISFLPCESKNVSNNFINRYYNDFFTKARKIAKKKILVLVSDDSLMKDYLNEFTIVEKREITAGNRYILYLLK